MEAIGHLPPQVASDLSPQIISLPSLNAWSPIGGLGKPVSLIPEEGLGQQDASDRVVLPGPWAIPAKMSGTLPNLVKTRSTVLLSERLPGEAYREISVVLEEPPTGDHVVWSNQFLSVTAAYAFKAESCVSVGGISRWLE